MSTTTPGQTDMKVETETERIIRERLATIDDDAKTATDARETLAAIRKNLERQKPR